jgi:SAM-dependent methyltransferase
MTKEFSATLLDQASDPFRKSGRFAYHYARGKLSSDPIFREILRRGLLPAKGRFLDLGCGQGSLFAWLLAARRLFESGVWPANWPVPPEPSSLRGIELMQKDVDRAGHAFGLRHPSVLVTQGDMTTADFGLADAVTILDALHYIDFGNQADVLRRIRAALSPGGIFLTRVGDASAGLPYRLCNWVDHTVTFMRGHRLPRLYCRRLADWISLIEGFGFTVEPDAMKDGKPFANVMLVCRVTD